MKKSFYLQSLLVFCFILCSATIVRATVPTITKNPVSAIVCQNDTTSFFIAANDTPGLTAITYSWQVSGNGGVTWSTLTKDTLFYVGTGTDSLVIVGDASIDGNLFRAIATNSDGADTSSSALLTVRQLPNAGAFTGDTAVCKSTTTNLSYATGGGVWSSSATTIATVGTSGTVTAIKQGFATISYTLTNMCGTKVTTSMMRVDTNVTALPITGPTTLCKGGGPVTLSNTNVLGNGVWTAFNANASVTPAGKVYGISGGTDIITYTFTNSCNSVFSTVGVLIDTLLHAGAISGTSSVCVGSWIHLRETVGGGLWISGNTAIGIVDGSGNVTGVSQGSVTISYYLTNGCGASIATDTISVIRTAAMIGGIDSVGIGNTRTLTDSTPGGMWYSSDTAIAIIDTFSGVVTGKALGTTTITYTVTNICGTSAAYLLVYVGNAPDPGVIFGTTDSSVCVGGTMSLSDTAKGGNGAWSSMFPAIATVSSTGVVTGVATTYDTAANLHAGVDTIIYTFTNAFGSSVAKLPIVVNQAPVLSVTGPAIVGLGGNYFFRGTPYQDWTHTPSFFTTNNPATNHVGVWTHSNPAVGTFVAIIDSNDIHKVSFGSYVVTGGGTDVITYTLQNECGSSSKTDTISLNLGDAVHGVSQNASALNVFPNPSNGVFSISLTSATAGNAVVRISNVAGQEVSEMNVATNKAYNIRLDQPAGLYFITATTADGGKFETKITITK